MMNLNTLLPPFSHPNLESIQIKGLAIDSRCISPGGLFFAYPGEIADGRDYIDEAIAKGAVVVLQEGKEEKSEWRGDIPLISLPSVQQRVGEIAARFYDYPAKQLNVIGVTGTNGKSTVVHLLHQLFTTIHIKSAAIGTLGVMIGNDEPIPLNNTTPDALSLQKCFAGLVKKGVSIIVMEVSSHALSQGRVNGIDFHTGIFTNLSRDHLDYHKTMEDYREAKLGLFTRVTTHAVLNADDPSFEFFKKKCVVPVTTFSISNADADFYCSNINYYKSTTSAEIMHHGEGYALVSQLIGEFNVSNLLSVVATLKGLGIPLGEAIHSLILIGPPMGRLQAFLLKNGARVVVDYAHTPDALANSLKTLKSICEGKLICVFGCGGDRDQGKRPEMGRVAESLADSVILCDDNPRFEPSEKIIDDIVAGMSSSPKIIPDRKKAIETSIASSKNHDIILIAGKGHEDYQSINGIRYPCSDIEIVSAKVS
jgi:UDP-N-acetylmuramoyl-L-alanyl-D-glutamate--2,6-diaminopimelate ligase